MPIQIDFPSAKDDSYWSSLSEDSSELVRFIKGNTTVLNAYPSNNGDLLFDKEKEILLTTDSSRRISLSNFIFLNTEQERTEITEPLTKLYLVKETGKLWFWDPTNLWWMLLNTGEAKTKNINAHTLVPASSIHIPLGGTGVFRLQMSVLNFSEEIYLSLGNSSISAIVSQTVTSDNSYFVIYRYNENTDQFYCIAYTDLIENLFSFVGRQRHFFSHVNEQIINTSDLYYLGIVTNANGAGLLGNNSTIINNAPYMNCFVDNIIDVDFSTTLASLNGEDDLKVNPIGQAILLNLSSYKNE